MAYGTDYPTRWAEIDGHQSLFVARICMPSCRTAARCKQVGSFLFKRLAAWLPSLLNGPGLSSRLTCR